MSEAAVLGIELGKTSCSVSGMSADGQIVLRRRMARDALPALLAKLPRCVVAMEACCGVHHVGRGAAVLGHQVPLMPPEYVRPYVTTQKNDDRDAEAIAEAATSPTMCFLPLKSDFAPCMAETESAIGAASCCCGRGKAGPAAGGLP